MLLDLTCIATHPQFLECVGVFCCFWFAMGAHRWPDQHEFCRSDRSPLPFPPVIRSNVDSPSATQFQNIRNFKVPKRVCGEGCRFSTRQLLAPRPRNSRPCRPGTPARCGWGQMQPMQPRQPRMTGRHPESLIYPNADVPETAGTCTSGRRDRP